jgi:hypothetical protein
MAKQCGTDNGAVGTANECGSIGLKAVRNRAADLAPAPVITGKRDAFEPVSR